jgi:hypothetical protein
MPKYDRTSEGIYILNCHDLEGGGNPVIHIPYCRDSDGAERIPTPNSRRYLDGGGRNL